MADRFDELAEELIDLFRSGVEGTLDDDRFDELARRVFAHQFEANPVYRAFCRGRGVEPQGLAHWTEIPAVPTRAFKRFTLVSGPEESVEVVFETSGTTGGRDARGRHPVLDLRLYHASLLSSFRHHVLFRESEAGMITSADAEPDQRSVRPVLVSLLPHPDRAPASSLSHMIGVVEEGLCAPGGGWFVDPARGLLDAELAGCLGRIGSGPGPVLVVGTAFSFVHWIDSMDEAGRSFRLPPGSRVMETGGFKGLSRTVERGALHAAIREKLGVGAGSVVNEYGMTELLSQFYSRSSSSRHSSGEDAAAHEGPPWVRTRILDPSTLEPVPEGSPGLLCHYDLANLGSVMAVLTEDLGVAAAAGGTDGSADRFTLLGRAADVEPRGCSLAMDEILSQAGTP